MNSHIVLTAIILTFKETLEQISDLQYSHEFMISYKWLFELFNENSCALTIKHFP